MNWFMLSLLSLLLLISCKSKKEDEKTFFSLTPFIQSQVKAMDSSISRIIAIRTTDAGTDTIDVHRDEFRTYAKDFLSLPDISTKKRKKNFEESVMFDEPSRSVLLNYTPTDADEEIRRETIILNTDAKGNGEVKSFIVDWFQDTKDSVVIKNMLWHVNKSFQVITKTTPANQQERISVLEVKWE